MSWSLIPGGITEFVDTNTPLSVMSSRSLTPETIQNLEQCCADLFALYQRAMEAAKVLEQRARAAQREWARMQGERYRELLRGNEPSPNAKKIWDAALAERDRYERNRAKLRSKANLYRRQAETILKVLEWAAPDKDREDRVWARGKFFMPTRAAYRQVTTRILWDAP
jgi:hypothetical protein